ncbi:MAG: CRISPR-associated endonuclease Cas2 [Candidatus Omnitrophica bacterium]|nr:CRISPR-associated endonuclease Cas2 [Candidatus Omnitrophota bacterium]MCM8827658.1 CRISPR-associated endonuclease Cas2 [Candidatus Omnitrophota bacterium]
MFFIISYDIPDDKRRNKVSQTLENYGTRVQYSVFECIIEKEMFEELKDRLKGIIKLEEDSVRFYQLCETCLRKVEISGIGEITRDEEIYII